MPCRPPEVVRSLVVAEALPCVPHAFRSRDREVLHGREAQEEAWPVLGDPRHLGLLQHHLRYEDLVRIPGASPGEVPAMAAEPRDEVPPKMQAPRSRIEDGLSGHRGAR